MTKSATVWKTLFERSLQLKTSLLVIPLLAALAAGAALAETIATENVNARSYILATAAENGQKPTELNIPLVTNTSSENAQDDLCCIDP